MKPGLISTDRAHGQGRVANAFLCLAAFSATAAISALAQNTNCCGDAVGVKYVQYPDVSNGLDFDANLLPPDPISLFGWVLADDFPCTNSGPITNIVLWGSWLNDDVDANALYTLSIWSDAPTNTANPFSHPDLLLWTQTYASGEYTRCIYTSQPEIFAAGAGQTGSSTNLWQLCFPAPATNTFIQTGTPTALTNYWLLVAVQGSPGPPRYFGWKQSAAAYNDAALASVSGALYPGPGDWFPLIDQQDNLVNLAFAVITSNYPCALPLIQCTNRVVECGTSWTIVPPPVVDQCCLNPGPATLAGAVTNGLACPQVITLNWQYTDCQQRTVTCAQLVSIVISPVTLTNCCGSTNEAKYVQYPDLVNGFDLDTTFSPPDPISLVGWVVADDFPCTLTGPITDIVLWGAWLHDARDPDATYTLSIWSDVPTNAANSFSHPGVPLWTQTYTNGQYTLCHYADLFEGFYNAFRKSMDYSTNLYQICFQTDPGNIFFQTGTPTAPTNYWLSVAVQSALGANLFFGWKSSATAYNDSAVGSHVGALYPAPGDWFRLRDLHGQALNLAFAVTTSTNGCPSPIILCGDRLVECGTDWSILPPLVSDPCCANPAPPTLTGAVTNGTTCSRLITLTWQYTNCLQQTATCDQKIFMWDTTPPAVTCSDNKTVPCGVPWTFDPPTGQDACCGDNVTVTPLGLPVTNSVSCPLMVKQTWAIADCCGNTTFCTQTVTVMDTNQPVMVCPTNLIVKACDTNPVVVNWTLGAALTCGNLAGIASSPPSGTAFLPDTTNTITAWAWTQCLVTNSCTFTVAVARALLDLTMTYSAGNITLHWADGVLQQASVVTGPYADVPLASPPAYTIPANQIQSFYRLRCGTPVRQVTINNGPGDQTDPHVSGDLVVYADATSLSIRYYSFLTRADTSVPQSPTDVDTLPDISGTRIAFSRAYFDRRACMVYDIMANTLTEIAPQAGTLRFDTALAGNTVAFVEQTVGNGEIMVYDLATQGPLINASLSPEIDLNPRLAPLGDVVVWDRCNSSYSDCRIMKSVRTGGVWGPATIVSGPSGVASDEGSPDTDGTWVVYQSIRPSATGPDIYFRPLAGGPETQLAIPGSQYYPSIKSGVIAFQSVAPAFGSASDIYVYIIAKSMLIQVTNTFLVNEVLNDIDVLPNGDIRVVWAADDGPFNEYNVYALTFTPP